MRKPFLFFPAASKVLKYTILSIFAEEVRLSRNILNYVYLISCTLCSKAKNKCQVEKTYLNGTRVFFHCSILFQTRTLVSRWEVITDFTTKNKNIQYILWRIVLFSEIFVTLVSIFVFWMCVSKGLEEEELISGYNHDKLDRKKTVARSEKKSLQDWKI